MRNNFRTYFINNIHLAATQGNNKTGLQNEFDNT